MNLSRLETDLLGDMAEDAHHLAEVFQFVWMHHGDLADRELQSIAKDLLLSWIARGWLQIVEDAPPFVDEIADLTALTAAIDEPHLRNGVWHGPNACLWLTPKAWTDVAWPPR